MDLNRKNMKKILLLVFLSILLLVGLLNLSKVFAVAKILLGFLMPLIVGCCIAFIFNTLLLLIEDKLFAPLNRKNFKVWTRIRRPICLTLTVGLIAGVVFILLFLIVPELKRTFTVMIDNMPTYIKQIQSWTENLLKTWNIPAESLTIQINWEKIGSTFVEYFKNDSSFLNKTVDITASIFNGIFNFVLGIVFAIYILLQKEKLGNQVTRILYAYCPKHRADRVIEVATLSYKTFSRFVTGQFTEAVIIGILCFLGMQIFRMPYAPMISALVGATALIPVFGAFIGTGIGAFLILMDSPIKAVWFVVFIIVLQQLEGDIIYPKVVGSSVGLPGIWVLFAVTLGGCAMGVVGMLISVPISSILYSLLREAVDKRLARKQIKIPDDVGIPR